MSGILLRIFHTIGLTNLSDEQVNLYCSQKQRELRTGRYKPIVVILIFLLVLATSGYLLIKQIKEAQLQKSQEEFESSIAQTKALLQQYLKSIKSFEEKAAITEEKIEGKIIADAPMGVDVEYADSALTNLEIVIEALIRILSDKNESSFVRAKAAYALGEIKSQKAEEPLIQALKDPDVRSYAAYALGKIKSEKAVEPLIQALKDEDPDVRAYAADALGKIKSENAVEPLIQALKDENSSVLVAAVKALGEIKSEKAVEPLIQALKDKERDVRNAVIEALAALGMKSKEKEK